MENGGRSSEGDNRYKPIDRSSEVKDALRESNSWSVRLVSSYLLFFSYDYSLESTSNNGPYLYVNLN